MVEKPTLLEPGRAVVTRRRNFSVMDAFEKAHMAVASPGETEDMLRRWRYACGKNYRHAARHHEETLRQIRELTDEADRNLAKFNEAKETTTLKYCQRLPGGEPDIDELPDGRRTYKFTPENRKLLDSEVASLLKQFASDIEVHKAILARRDAVLDQEIELTLHRWAWESVPACVNGDYLVELTPMLAGVPESLLVDLEEMSTVGEPPSVETMMERDEGPLA